MRQAGVRITDPVYNRYAALVVERFDRAHRRMQSKLIGDYCGVAGGIDQFGILEAKSRSGSVIIRICVRHDGVQAVISAFELNDNEYSAPGGSRQVRSLCCGRQKLWGKQPNCYRACSLLYESASGYKHWFAPLAADGDEC